MGAAVALAGLMTMLQALPADWRGLLAYNRVLVSGGEIWRLLTSNFVHIGWGHLLLNGAGLLVLAWLFAGDRRTANWGVDLLICSVATGAGLFLFNPEIPWCVGLSGALHGLFAVGAINWIREGMSQGKWLLAGLATKLAWEQFAGEMPLTGELVGAPVVTDAHLWGSIGGLMAAVADGLWRRLAPRL
jgi:rhomboid family GlyGly-CTERM serine protease